ncbi:MAG: c-type cytochrome [Balneolaceae bacterium]|nr:c-type cytochrome [Balneolaceae bacterium]
MTDVTYESTPQRVTRGKYLAEGLYCLTCHTERDTTVAGWPPIMEKQFSGSLRFETDSTYLYAPNLTPDEETGSGTFTDDMLARAIREGVGHDGRRLVPVGLGGMPSGSFKNLTDEDLASIIVYLRSIPPINNEIPTRNIGRMREEQIQDRWHPILDDLVEPDFTDPVSRGKYLISVSDCFGCQTGWSGRNPGVFGGGLQFGNEEKNISSPNISSDPTGIGNWTAETFISMIRNGKNGILDPVMPWISYRNLTDEDLTDIYLALKQSQPVKHLILNGATPTYCEVCETEHGLGSTNHLEEIQPFSNQFVVPLDYAGTYVNQVFEADTLRLTISENKLILDDFEFIPVSETDFLADGFFAPIRFNRDLEGKVTSLNFRYFDRDVYRKIE